MAKILLIQTDCQLSKLTSDFLGRFGHSVDAHSDIQAAILSADTQLPDIIILDLILAGRSGVEFLYELRSYPEWQNIPTLITGNYPVEEMQDFSTVLKALNVADYVYAPTTSLTALLARIDALAQPVAV